MILSPRTIHYKDCCSLTCRTVKLPDETPIVTRRGHSREELKFSEDSIEEPKSFEATHL